MKLTLTDRSCSSATSTTKADVSYINTVPTNLATIATGHYGLPPLSIGNSPNACFNNTSQAAAWSCNMPFSYYSMDVTPNNNKSAPAVSGYQIVMAAINQTNAEFIWGTQPPQINDPTTLQLVWDTYAPERGPAWWTSFQYNKTVIVSESDFSALSTRGWDDDDDDHPFPPPSQFKKKSKGAKEGDRPWICTWPDVTLELFIYPKQNTSSSWTTTTTSTAASATATESIDTDDVVPPSYPKVLKMLELRYLYNKNQIASCRHVEIVDGGKQSKDIIGGDGSPEEVTIVENYPWSQKLQNNQRYRQVPKRWVVRDILARSQVELTDCACLWWST